MGSQRQRWNQKQQFRYRQVGGWVGMGALVGRSHSGHAISAALSWGGLENSVERNTGLSTHEAWFLMLALP